MAFWSKSRSVQQEAAVEDVISSSGSQISDGSLVYTGNKGGNTAAPTYQDASGAPIEAESPMGYSVSAFTILFLNINMMIGTGIFSTRKYRKHFARYCISR